MKKILLLIALCAFGWHAQAQQQEPIYCGFDVALQKLAEKHDGFQEQCTQQHAFAVRESKANRGKRNTVYEIPVVFHVVYNTPDQNVGDEVIEDQMVILNQDYRRLNPNAIDTRDEFLPFAADTELEFVLATEDPEGNPTNGIIHYETDQESFFFDILSQDEITIDDVKFSETGGADAWDTDRYLNIWVCNITASFGAQIFGFAYPPNGAANWEGFFDVIPDEVEGVVVHYTAVGSNNPAGLDDNFSGNEGGRTLTHEVGHYLGLRHTWGDGFFNGCSVDDGISDTPNIEASNNFTCTFNSNTCDEGAGDLPDQSENFMDYNQDDCFNMFTNEQKDVMRFNLETFRTELIEDQIVSVNTLESSVLEIWPNPANGVVQIELVDPAQVQVVDISGRVVLDEKLNSGVSQLNVDLLSNGTYTVICQNESITTTHKLIVQK